MIRRTIPKQKPRKKKKEKDLLRGIPKRKNGKFRGYILYAVDRDGRRLNYLLACARDFGARIVMQRYSRGRIAIYRFIKKSKKK